ncbi:hypothetical protein K461DRAFT_278615 [Myriangium duriaei CBS 260.36]|uniref:Uncharacterized protein n=1 Tax=Myriangium duriaei CBS 260.36 TaxID=1168546 RepID=A0A9P4IYU4_9PEZI|nr:hypothetical protein K461DRAFT_278615 [Myriangium duriaei CBS 260.36]
MSWTIATFAQLLVVLSLVFALLISFIARDDASEHQTRRNRDRDIDAGLVAAGCLR